MKTKTDQSFNIDPHSFENSFLFSAGALSANAMFGVPERVQNIIDKNGNNVKIVVLGTKGFGSHLLDKNTKKFNALASVDDFRCHSGALYYGTPIVSTDKFIDISKSNDIIAVNTCRYDGPKRFFDNVCRMNNIPHINFEQAVRAFRMKGLVDYRVDDWGKDITQNVERYQALAKIMVDNFSQQTLFSVLGFHLNCEPEYYHQIERPYSTLYFRSGLLHFAENERMVDCGASLGESLAGLIGVTKG